MPNISSMNNGQKQRYAQAKYSSNPTADPPSFQGYSNQLFGKAKRQSQVAAAQEALWSQQQRIPPIPEGPQDQAASLSLYDNMACKDNKANPSFQFYNTTSSFHTPCQSTMGSVRVQAHSGKLNNSKTDKRQNYMHVQAPGAGKPNQYQQTAISISDME